MLLTYTSAPLNVIKYSRRPSNIRDQTYIYVTRKRKRRQILMQHWHLIQQQPLLRRIFKDSPIVSYKKGRSIKDILVRAKLKLAITRGWELCSAGLSLHWYSGTPLYGHPLNTDTPVLRTVSLVPTKTSYIFSKINPLYTDTRTDNGHFSVSPVTNSYTLSTSLYGHCLSVHGQCSLSQSFANFTLVK